MRPYLFLVLFFSLHTMGQEPVLNLQKNSSVTESQTIQGSEIDFILGQRDPFSPPKYIRELEPQRPIEQGRKISPMDIIDDQMEAIRRWPLTDYRLLAVIWDVKNPKAMVMDKSNTMHLLKKNYRIGNREGVIAEINESEVVVLQNGVPVVLQIFRTSDLNKK